MKAHGVKIYNMEMGLSLGLMEQNIKYFVCIIVYKGSYANGKKSGKGILTFGDGSYYTGEFKDNEITGYGEYYWKDGKFYKGSWKNSKMTGNKIF